MRKLLVALSVVMCMVSCKSFNVNVKLENSTGKTVYLQKYDGTKMNTIDSVVAKDNTAVFKVRQSKNLDPYSITMKGWKRPVTVFADNQDATIIGDCQKYGQIKVQASENQEKINDFTKQVNLIEDEKEMYYFVLDFVKQNINNLLSPYAAYRYKWLFSLDEMETIYEAYPENLKTAYKDLVKQYIETLKLTSAGMMFTDFTQKDVNGNDFSLSSVVGKAKVIILDFWASWCPDCRKENPNLVQLYNEFKDKGLDIVSVSLDTDEAAWKKAITDDNLYWEHHVSDLKGWQNAVAQTYMVSFIPQNLLLDENGKIVERNLPFEKLKEMAAMMLE